MADELAWVSEGKGKLCAYEISKLLHDTEGPVVVVDTTDGLLWRFQFSNRNGNGAIAVGQGCRYNPLSMIESLWAAFEDGELVNLSPTATINLDSKSVENGDWSSLFTEDDL